MRFPVVIHKDQDSDYGVTVPDLPGCFSAGETVDEALKEVVEAIETHLEGMLLDSEPIPAPKTVEFYKDDPDFATGIWAVVNVDISKLSGRSKRVNITIPERLLSLMDQFVAERGETRSGLIAQATMEYIAAHRQ
ncbi:MAG: type II toxin-antitoxin system HicB family antitoxin [Anaerolineales bacterium]|nr:type II toxin-antitoxin system HicB family antitoxin [Anaerolineales bacterium]